MYIPLPRKIMNPLLHAQQKRRRKIQNRQTQMVLDDLCSTYRSWSAMMYDHPERVSEVWFVLRDALQWNYNQAWTCEQILDKLDELFFEDTIALHTLNLQVAMHINGVLRAQFYAWLPHDADTSAGREFTRLARVGDAS